MERKGWEDRDGDHGVQIAGSHNIIGGGGLASLVGRGSGYFCRHWLV